MSQFRTKIAGLKGLVAAAALAAAAFAAAPASADIQLIHTQLDSHFATLTNNQTNQSYYVYDAPVTFTDVLGSSRTFFTRARCFSTTSQMGGPSVA